MKTWRGSLMLILVAIIAGGAFILTASAKPKDQEITLSKKEAHWFMLHRKSNVEYFYYGVPGEKSASKLLKTFTVKTGIPRERPTPLPRLVGREYWILTKKESSADNPETAPYFLTLNVPGGDKEPFGPSPYLECGEAASQQCNWSLPGAFGLHGVNGDESRLSDENSGSSGCIRHKDEDITYLYNLLNPQKEEIRYYIENK
jgi:lipoprotein-anchoring transpeptidase ErfK/SrfK